MTEPAEPCVLHVAALAFPSYQGTQASIRAMLEASVRSGWHAELFSYAASGYAYTPNFALHRGSDFPRQRTLRSGPNLTKLVLDAGMLWQLQRVVEAVKPSVVVAHHVEAAAVALALHRVPCVFFAHTDLEAELPSYAHARWQTPLAWAGRQIDQQLTRRADALATISPTLRDLCRRDRAVTYVPTPWTVPEPITRDERAAARSALALSEADCVALYAGNLDAYQTPYCMLDALARAQRLGQRITLLLATESDPRAFIDQATRTGIAFRTSSLAGELLRRRVHAAADFAIIPRGAPGGLPIKLLDALARGVACAISLHAAAGIDLHDVTACASAQGPEALSEAIIRLAQDPSLRERLAARGREYIAREHCDERFSQALAAAVQAAQRRFDERARCSA